MRRVTVGEQSRDGYLAAFAGMGQDRTMHGIVFHPTEEKATRFCWMRPVEG